MQTKILLLAGSTLALGFAAGIAVGQMKPPAESKGISADQLRSLDLTGEIDSVKGRPLRMRRILLLPVIAGLAYELIRYAGKHQDNRVLMTLLAPGLWLQRLTTREPSDDQVEVSIQALQRVIEKEAAESPEEQRLESRVEVMA